MLITLCSDYWLNLSKHWLWSRSTFTTLSGFSIFSTTFSTFYTEGGLGYAGVTLLSVSVWVWLSSDVDDESANCFGLALTIGFLRASIFAAVAFCCLFNFRTETEGTSSWSLSVLLSLACWLDRGLPVSGLFLALRFLSLFLIYAMWIKRSDYSYLHILSEWVSD